MQNFRVRSSFCCCFFLQMTSTEPICLRDFNFNGAKCTKGELEQYLKDYLPKLAHHTLLGNVEWTEEIGKNVAQEIGADVCSTESIWESLRAWYFDEIEQVGIYYTSNTVFGEPMGEDEKEVTIRAVGALLDANPDKGGVTGYPTMGAVGVICNCGVPWANNKPDCNAAVIKCVKPQSPTPGQPVPTHIADTTSTLQLLDKVGLPDIVPDTVVQEALKVLIGAGYVTEELLKQMFESHFNTSGFATTLGDLGVRSIVCTCMFTYFSSEPPSKKQRTSED
jgi:hypothetical protein